MEDYEIISKLASALYYYCSDCVVCPTCGNFVRAGYICPKCGNQDYYEDDCQTLEEWLDENDIEY